MKKKLLYADTIYFLEVTKRDRYENGSPPNHKQTTESFLGTLHGTDDIERNWHFSNQCAYNLLNLVISSMQRRNATKKCLEPKELKRGFHLL